jgi:alkylated DNA repair protein alkB family protein 6
VFLTCLNRFLFLTGCSRYTPHFAIISLESSIVIHFYSKRTESTPSARLFSLLLEPGSLLIVAGEAYTDLLHGIDNVTEDPIDRFVVNVSPDRHGTVMQRESRRVSLTIRHVKNVKDASKLFKFGIK